MMGMRFVQILAKFLSMRKKWFCVCSRRLARSTKHYVVNGRGGGGYSHALTSSRESWNISPPLLAARKRQIQKDAPNRSIIFKTFGQPRTTMVG